MFEHTITGEINTLEYWVSLYDDESAEDLESSLVEVDSDGYYI
jgi:hypothetical protein